MSATTIEARPPAATVGSSPAMTGLPRRTKTSVATPSPRRPSATSSPAELAAQLSSAANWLGDGDEPTPAAAPDRARPAADHPCPVQPLAGPAVGDDQPSSGAAVVSSPS